MLSRQRKIIDSWIAEMKKAAKDSLAAGTRVDIERDLRELREHASELSGAVAELRDEATRIETKANELRAQGAGLNETEAAARRQKTMKVSSQRREIKGRAAAATARVPTRTDRQFPRARCLKCQQLLGRVLAARSALCRDCRLQRTRRRHLMRKVVHRSSQAVGLHAVWHRLWGPPLQGGLPGLGRR
jgi:hypothetical protein